MFVGKLTVFTAAVDGGFAWLAVLAIVNTVASVFYYLRWIAPAVLSRPDPSELRGARTRRAVVAGRGVQRGGGVGAARGRRGDWCCRC